MVRSNRGTAEVGPAVRDALDAAAFPNASSASVWSFEQAFREITTDRRATARLMLVCVLAVVLIGSAGVYAVMSSVVSESRFEFAVRMVLGASPGSVLAGVMSRAAVLVALGLAVGVPVGIAISTLFESMLFGVTPLDPQVHVVVIAILLSAGFAAAARPALKARGVNPAESLRLT